MLTRRTATVIISAPDASCACTMTAGDEYLPVPTISRDVNVLSAIVNLSTVALPSADEIDDFHLIAVAYQRRIVGGAPDDDEVVLDGDAARVDFQPGEQRGHRQRRVDFIRVAVQRNPREPIHRYDSTGKAAGDSAGLSRRLVADGLQQPRQVGRPRRRR